MPFADHMGARTAFGKAQKSARIELTAQKVGNDMPDLPEILCSSPLLRPFAALTRLARFLLMDLLSGGATPCGGSSWRGNSFREAGP